MFCGGLSNFIFQFVVITRPLLSSIWRLVEETRCLAKVLGKFISPPLQDAYTLLKRSHLNHPANYSNGTAEVNLEDCREFNYLKHQIVLESSRCESTLQAISFERNSRLSDTANKFRKFFGENYTKLIESWYKYLNLL